jgi:hypothetical protein
MRLADEMRFHGIGVPVSISLMLNSVSCVDFRDLERVP